MHDAPTTADVSAFNLAAHVLAHAATQPDKVALAVLGLTRAERWSYGRLEAAVRGAATGLAARGLVPGARVLLRLGNTAEFPVAFLGAMAGGFVPVPTSAQLTRGEITAMAAALDPALVIAGEGIALPDHPAPVLPEADLRGFEALAPAPYALGPADRLGYIIFTSGSSGVPRAVAHAHRAILARAMMRAGWEGLGPADRLLHAGAFNWTYTLGTGLMDPWVAGATALIPGAGIEVAQLPLLMKRHEATILAAVPGIYRRLLRAPLPALPRLRHGLSAGEALPAATRAAWRAATGTDLHEAMGMSECSTFISGSPARPAPEGRMGYPQPGRRIAVLGEDGAPVPPGTPGVLAVHRSDPGLFLGYPGAPQETAARFAGDWFVTGDEVQADPDGALAYLGRADDMMNAGGYRLSPLEVEAAIAACPGAGEVAAVEQRLPGGASVIALYHTGPADAATLAAHAGAHLARYKQPRIFVRLDALPHNANGKIDRRALRDRADA